MKHYIFKHKWLFIGMTLLYVASAYFQVLFSFQLGDMVDTILTNDSTKLIDAGFKTCLSLFAVMIILIFASKMKRWISHEVILDMKTDITDKLFMLPYADFEKEDESFYLNLLSNDVHLLDEDYLKHICMTIMDTTQLVLALVSLLWISVKLTVGFSILFLLPVLVPMLFSKRLQSLKQKLSSSNENYTFCIKEIIEGYDCIRTNNVISNFRKRFTTDAKQREDALYRSSSLEINSGNTSGMLGGVAQVGCFIIGGILVINGEITVGLLMSAIQLLNFVFNPMTQLSQSLAYIASAKPVLAKVTNFLGMEIKTNRKLEKLKQDDDFQISYEGVSFGYVDHPIIANFDYTFEAGKKYAVVGESGCGKSTLTRLLMKYYGNYNGKIQINDQEVRNVTDYDIYDLISTVHQSTFIFNDTILNNITMKHEYPKEKIDDVIKRCNLEQLVNQYGDKKIGDFGKGISGGERQRIAIARSLLKESKVIIFDEACASLDPNNAADINDLILSLEGITCIVITHDWNKKLLDRFDQVIELTPCDVNPTLSLAQA